MALRISENIIVRRRIDVALDALPNIEAIIGLTEELIRKIRHKIEKRIGRKDYVDNLKKHHCPGVHRFLRPHVSVMSQVEEALLKPKETVRTLWEAIIRYIVYIKHVYLDDEYFYKNNELVEELKHMTNVHAKNVRNAVEQYADYADIFLDPRVEEEVKKIPYHRSHTPMHAHIKAFVIINSFAVDFLLFANLFYELYIEGCLKGKKIYPISHI